MLTRAACGPRRAPPAPRALRSVAPRPLSRACIATRATPRSTRPTKTGPLTARLLTTPPPRSSIGLCLPCHSARNIASQRSAVALSLPRILSHNGSASKAASVLDVKDPTVVFPILTALILGAALALLAQDDEVDAAEEQRGRLAASDRAGQYAQAGMTIDELREQTSPFFRIAEAPQDLTVLERINDVFWAAVETMRTFFRFIELSMRFTPLFIASPLLLTPLADYWYKILLHTLRTSGACFIKLGQWAATRKDIFPDDLTTRLSTLHTQAPFHSLEETREMFRRVFGREIEELFDDFNPIPIASGAIAQVYRARLRSGKVDSGDLILKVRHPGVAEGIERDLRILRRSVQIMEVLLGLGWLHPVETVDVFRSNMLAQIDLAVEAANLERFRNNFAGVTTVRFPRPIRMLCRPEVLVETFEEGKLISEFVNNAVDPKLRQNIASLGMDTYLKMMIEDSFTHADLHPGNILVDTRSTPPQIVILDCGLVVKLSQKDRRNFVNLFSTVIEGDSQRAARLMTEDQPHLTPKAIKEFGEAIKVPFEELANKGLAEINVSQVMGGILSAARRTRVRVDPAFTTLVVGTAVLEGLGRQLDPNINLIKHAAPFLRGDPQARRAWVRATLNRGLFTFS